MMILPSAKLFCFRRIIQNLDKITNKVIGIAHIMIGAVTLNKTFQWRTSMKNKFLILTMIIFTTTIIAENINTTIIPTKHNKQLTIGVLAEIQPGLGTIMMEFEHRFYVAYYAAKADNWELAKYQIHELLEAQEIAEVTRPKYAKQLKSFEDDSIKKLQNAIESKDWKLFKQRYDETTNACNACHKTNGHPYIHYQLPKEAPKYLRMSL